MADVFSHLCLSMLTKLRELKHAATHSIRPTHNAVFDDIYKMNGWESSKSVSGPGSELAETEDVRALLPSLLAKLQIRTLLDVPCGDFSWMRHVDLGETSYIGGDIVKTLIDSNNSKYRTGLRNFVVLDLMRDRLPAADLILCRDCLIHLSLAEAKTALTNLRTSGASYLLITTDPSVRANRPIRTGEYRAINLELPPFNMKYPLSLHRDRRNTSGEQLIDPHKSLALYKLH